MSVCLGLVTLGDVNIERVLEDPPLVWRVLAPHNSDIYQEARKGTLKPSRRSGLSERGGTRLHPGFGLSESEGIETYLGKSWHGIQYLLNREAWEGQRPLNFLVASGRPVGDIDIGCGPARVFSALEMTTIQKGLEAVTNDELRTRFSPTDMVKKDIYPGDWDRDPNEDNDLEYLIQNVELLRGFLRKAVETRVGAVVYLA